jgi:ribosome-binding protein aMBF1 (putative translation factor)
MSAHMKGRPTNREKYIEVIVDIPGLQESIYKIPYSRDAKQRLKEFFQKLASPASEEMTPWEETVSWEKLAKERVAHYTKAGLALRGARYREGLTQKKLAKLCGISQENLSRMENGKRVIGEKVARKLAKVLHIDHHLLLGV